MSNESNATLAVAPALSGNDDEPSSARDPIADLPDDDYQWAEYNLPALLYGITSGDDEDKLAFVRFGIDSGIAVPDGSS